MTELVLLVPGWPAPPDGPSGEVPDGADGGTDGPLARCERSLTWRRVEPEPIEASLERALGLVAGADGDVPSANAWRHDLDPDARRAVAEAVDAGHGVVRADPVHLSPDRDTALLLAPEALGLTLEEGAALVAALDGFVAQDGMRLFAATAERWYMVGPDLPAVVGPPPQALAGRRLADGDGGVVPGPLRGLASELEMLLHGHPVNAARRASGRLAVTSLHLHGGARSWRTASGSAAGAGPAIETIALVTDDPFARAAGRAAGTDVVVANDWGALKEALASRPGTARAIVFDRALERAALTGDGAALAAGAGALAERWVVPALDALRAGELDSLGLHAGGARRAEPGDARPGPWWRRAGRALRRPFG